MISLFVGREGCGLDFRSIVNLAPFIFYAAKIPKLVFGSAYF
ncbi:hypothetical protein CAMRE0001_0033 [Campylobacter rectus RM3267]|uniref:Uncharacterized protein n=1 Tax=Campylobacter rectus RM3267 TaxID=553218 RepID=B9D3H9_CAMRE|nr:hypothetical protein CAMRE0001_0033 [Campylobacter rectus RM3267]